MGLGSSIRRAGRRIYAQANRAERQVGEQVDRAKDPNKGIWGDNPYLRWAERLTGASTFKSAVYRHTGGELDGNIDTQKDPYAAAKSDARLGRPTLSYTDEVTDRPARMAAAATMERNAREEQTFLAAAEREREKARSQIAVRVRRGSINRGGNQLGQTLAAGLGTTGATAGGSPTFASMLGL